MKYISEFAMLLIYGFLGTYMAAYVNDTRIVDDCYHYEYVPVGKFRFICLRQKNPRKIIRKITRDREILAVICSAVSALFIIVLSPIFDILNLNNDTASMVFYVFLFLILIGQLYFSVKVGEKCSSIVICNEKKLEVNEKNLLKHSRNLMRRHFEGENRSYMVQRQNKKTFWYDYTEYHLYVDKQYFQTIVKQQKYRYSSIVETKWYE